MDLTWDSSPNSDVAGYKVYYGSDSGDYTSTISAGAATDLEISSLLAGVTYYFAVTAYDSSGQESELSNEVSYTVPGISPPGAITSIRQPFPGVTVDWVPSPSADVIGYNVYFGTQSGYYSDQVSVTGTNEAVIYGLAQGVTYFFVVTASDSSGEESVYSSEASYTVPSLAPPGSINSIQPTLLADGVTLVWDPSPSAEVAGYNVYTSLYSGYGFNLTSISDTNEATIYGLLEGLTYYFHVTAYDDSGQESDFSGEVSYTVPGIAPPDSTPSIIETLSDQGIILAWNPSPTAGTAGYNVYYGTESGVYPDKITVNTSEASIYGLAEGLTYYFVVRAFDGLGQESDPSAEFSYYVEVDATTGPVLFLQQVSVEGFPHTLYITATSDAPPAWTLEASSDLINWRTLTTGTDSSVNVTVIVSEKPAAFFRLNSYFSDFELQVEKDPANQFPNSFAITTSDMVPWWWSLETSEDLQNWSPCCSGFYSLVNVAVVSAPTPALFFRLKGQ